MRGTYALQARADRPIVHLLYAHTCMCMYVYAYSVTERTGEIIAAVQLKIQFQFQFQTIDISEHDLHLTHTLQVWTSPFLRNLIAFAFPRRNWRQNSGNYPSFYLYR
jgi:hypothetical protein